MLEILTTNRKIIMFIEGIIFPYKIYKLFPNVESRNVVFVIFEPHTALENQVPGITY